MKEPVVLSLAEDIQNASQDVLIFCQLLSDWLAEIKRIAQGQDSTMLRKHLLLCTEVKAIRKAPFCLLEVVVLRTGQNLLAEAFSSVTKLQGFSQAR